jgi:hypothetical protein
MDIDSASASRFRPQKFLPLTLSTRLPHGDKSPALRHPLELVNRLN